MNRRILAAGAAAMVSAGAQGAVVVFDNADLSFAWNAGIYCAPPCQLPQPLDPIFGPGSQGFVSPRQFAYHISLPTVSRDPIVHRVGEAQRLWIAAGPTVMVSPFRPPTGVPCETSSSVSPPLPLSPGQTVDGSLTFVTTVTVYHTSPGCGSGVDMRQPMYVGIRLQTPGATAWLNHYGWVEFIFTTSPSNSTGQWRPVRWAYETTPETPIVIPAPCPADLDGDGLIGASDLAGLLGQWGGAGPADLDGDGVVSAGDLAAMLGAWGACE